MIRGSCLCGDVGWESDGPMELASHCHCSRCRKTHGAAFASHGGVPEDGFRWLRGRERVRRYESSPGVFRPFCSRCGSPLPGDPADGRIFVPLGGVEGDPGARPLAHIFAASKAPWHEIADDLPRFDAWPPGFELPVFPDAPSAEAPKGRVAGSCLCGGVAYEIDGEVAGIRSCHCSRCRKARGAAHASNLFAEAGRFRWLRGEALVDAYKVPEAERFAQCFCRVCGSALPRVDAQRGYVVVPAGGLDGDPGARESEHIFVGSKASWYEIGGPLPQHAEYPPA